MKIYRIRHHDTKKFHSGKYHHKDYVWVKTEGKSWNKLSILKAYLTNYKKKFHLTVIPDEWEVVEFDVVESSFKAAKDL